jgi:hypothetical protein
MKPPVLGWAPGELRQRVAEQRDGDDGGDDDQRRADAGREHDQAKPK